MKRITEYHVLILALVGILVFAILKASSASDSSDRPFSIRRSTPDGALALRLWLEKSGYQVKALSSNLLQLDEIDVLFLLEPYDDYTPAEAEAVYNWVTQGHTLIVADPWSRANSLLASFDVKLGRLIGPWGEASLASPTLTDPPFDGLYLDTVAEIETARRDLVFHLLVQDRPVLASFSEGQGTVWVMGCAYPFSNQGLQHESNARLIMNLLSDVPPPSTIGFDESMRAVEPSSPTLNDWVVSTPAGQSIILFAVLMMSYLLLRGRRFGRPQPVNIERLRREPTEYIQAVATLFRRSGQREEVLRHYRSELVRQLARRYAFDPRLNDDEVIRSLAVRDPAFDAQALAELLHDLSAHHVSEHKLVEITTGVDTWMAELGEKR